MMSSRESNSTTAASGAATTRNLLRNTHFLTLCLIPCTAIIFKQASEMNYEDRQNLYLHLIRCINFASVMIFCGVFLFGLTVYFMTRPRSVYLVDYACFRPPDHLRVKFHQFMEHSRLTGDFDESSLEFQRKILQRSGLGEETCVPDAMHRIPPAPSMSAAREEAEQVSD